MTGFYYIVINAKDKYSYYSTSWLILIKGQETFQRVPQENAFFDTPLMNPYIVKLK